MLTYHLWPASSPTMVSGYQTITLDASACGKSAVGPDPVCSGTFPWFALPGTDPNSALSNLGVKKVVSAMVQGAHPVPRGTLVTVQEVREKVFVLGDGASAMDNPITGFAAACAKPMMWPEPATHPSVVAYRSSARSQDASGMVPAIFAASGNKIFWLEFDSSDNNKTGWTEADYLRITHEAIALADQL